MIGAIIGDIVGSRFEFNNHRSKDFDLFHEDCQVTDDTIITLAVAKAIMETEKRIEASDSRDDFERNYDSMLEKQTITYMQEIGRRYPNCGYGGMFGQWVFSENPEPYYSFGNGAAMRISPVGFSARTVREVCKRSRIVTGVTHNHVEGIKGAEATVLAIFLARSGFTKREIRNQIHNNYYPLDFTIDEIRDTYQFNETCQETVPQAIVAFLESTSFEDAIRTAISVGGDSDTLAAITGAIAEAYYGVPENLRQKALSYFDRELLAIYDEWCAFDKKKGASEEFKVLTKYIERMSDNDSFGEWITDHVNDGTPEHPIQIPFVHYTRLVNQFVEEFYQFSENHPEYELTRYGTILENNDLRWDDRSMRDADVDVLHTQCILALIMGMIRADRFSEGILLRYVEEGYIVKCLKRLKFFDEKKDMDGKKGKSS